MRNSISKNNSTNKQEKGQYNTPTKIVSDLFNFDDISNIENYTIVEPSFGSGNVLSHIHQILPNNKIIGYELDYQYEYICNLYINSNVDTSIKNFYDIDNLRLDTPYIFVGNPPYRTPNESTKTHPILIKNLKNKFKIGAIKEEAVFFILHTITLCKQGDYIWYILPKTLFQNPTKAFDSFRNIFRNNLEILSIDDLPINSFENVNQDLVFCKFKVNSNTNYNYLIKYNNDDVHLDEFWKDDVFTFNDIFKKTYLGSVPSESIFLSCKGESIDSFKNRMVRLFDVNHTINSDNLLEYLSYNGMPHLVQLKNKNKKKINTITSYVNQIKNNPHQDLSIFGNMTFYKSINHRKEIRYYFRHNSLKKYDFVYILNPNPKKSFYFTGNPTKISSDYFGYTEYDINRNSSPGACRTVPIENIEMNLKPKFIQFWHNNTTRPLADVFEYLIGVSKSNWWIDRKNKLNKQYFSIPTDTIHEDFFF
jgi:hypothetical protein